MHFQRNIATKTALAILFFLLLLLDNKIFAQECKANVSIISNKDNTMVYIDSVLVGRGNTNIELAKGNHILRMNESSFLWDKPEIRDTLIITDCSKDYLFKYELKPKSITPINQANFEIGRLKTTENFFTSITFKILLGSAAVLGGIAAYYKIQADKKYDDYLSSKNQSTLDEVNRLDRYSGISFGLLQINFGYLIYKFLTD